MEDVVWFSEVGKDDTKSVGGKGANLGELYNLKLPVPNGFIVTSQAYFSSVSSSGTLDRIRSILYGLDVENPLLLETKAKACQQEIKKIKLQTLLQKKIDKFYEKLSAPQRSVFVAVRSSATAEDLPQASFAGQQSTFLNVRGAREVKEAILASWASLFEARAIFYRVQENFDHFRVGIAVPVQKMVQPEVSGVMFTLDPVTNNKDKITIEAIFGLGELIVAGSVTPDHYEIDKRSFKITIKNIVSQEKQLVKTKGANKILAVSKPFQRVQKLSDDKLIELARIGQKIEKHYYFPQDIEWAYKGGKLYIVQTRPVTTLTQNSKLKTQNSRSQLPPTSNQLLLRGAPASPVIATGRVSLIKSKKELYKVQKGDVLVTEMTNPDFVPAMKKAVAIVTDRGGRTSHAAIVSRELGIACVVGTGEATKKLKDGMIITVDGAKGLVFKGKPAIDKKDLAFSKNKNLKPHKTATKLYVNLAEPYLAPQIAAKDVDGVGLLRAEFMLAQIGVHPKKFLEDGQKNKFIEKLSQGLSTIVHAFGRRPVIYRASDLKSNEYKGLKGGDKFEPKEANPMLGYRGAFRYIKDPDIFKMELEAIKSVREKHSNLHLMIQYVRNVSELAAVRKLVEEAGLFKDDYFKFWMMVEIPSNAILLNQFIKVGIDGISIGSNDLTMLILGTDRDNEEVASEFTELDEAVLWAFKKIVKTANAAGITCSICGQAPSIYPELTEKLVSWGITSISVNPDAIDSTREIIYQAEHELVTRNQNHGND